MTPAAAEPKKSPLAIDTSVAVPALLAAHEAHDRVVARLAGSTGHLAGHALFETYAVLTRLPPGVRLTADDCAVLLADRFGPPAGLDGPGLEGAFGQLVAAGIVGGAVYDGLVGLAARAHGLRLLTRDTRAIHTYRRLDVEVELVG